MTTLQFDEWQDAGGTPVLRFEAGVLEAWDGSAWAAAGVVGTPVEYLICGGGGGPGAGGFGGGYRGGGGGAGGYLANIDGESSGGGVTNYNPLTLVVGTYSVIVGAGGAGGNAAPGTDGSPSSFANFVAFGGGGGGVGSDTTGTPGRNGGSGGGGGSRVSGAIQAGGLAYYSQGFAGGDGTSNGSGVSGTGGGAGGAGPTALQSSGGPGLSSSVTGSPVTRCTGGGNDGLVSGGANTGDGGGALISNNSSSVSGGSGVVIIAVPTGSSVTFSGGVTQTSAVVGTNDVYTVTATSTTSETVTFA